MALLAEVGQAENPFTLTLLIITYDNYYYQKQESTGEMWQIYKKIPNMTADELRFWIKHYQNAKTPSHCDMQAKIVYAATLRLMELGHSPTPPPDRDKSDKTSRI